MAPAISSDREKLKRQIEANKSNGVPALIFQATDQAIRLVTRGREPLPLWYIVLFLALLIQLPTLIIVILSREYSQWNDLGLIWIGFLELGLLSPLMVYYLMLYLARELRMSVIDALHTRRDLNDLQISLDSYWDARKYWLNTILFAVIWCFAFSGVSSIYLQRFIGLGLTSGTIIFGLLAGSGYSYLPWFVRFTYQLGHYEFRLFDLDPAHSSFVAHIKSFYSNFIYAIMGYFLLATIANAFNVWAELFIVIIAWIPAVLLFLVYQTSLGRIIERSKWKYLNKLQSQMVRLSKNSISDRKAVEDINHLMDYHERIRLTPNSALDLKSALNFFNQLMLPILGLLLTNIEKIIDFFR